jgi:hypothetical protein
MSKRFGLTKLVQSLPTNEFQNISKSKVGIVVILNVSNTLKINLQMLNLQNIRIILNHYTQDL